MLCTFIASAWSRRFVQRNISDIDLFNRQLRTYFKSYLQSVCTICKCNKYPFQWHHTSFGIGSYDIDWRKTTIWTKSRAKVTIHNMYCPPGINSGLPLINEAKTKTIIAGDYLPQLRNETYNMGREVEALNIENHIHLLQNEQS